MNRAIFKFSFFGKFTNVLDWLILAGIVLGPSAMLAVIALNVSDIDFRGSIAEHLFSFIDEPPYLMLLAFLFISDGVVGRRIIGDAAPLSMVFSRPITRLSYVFSKWLAGSLGAMCLLLPAGLIFQMTASLLGVKEALMDGYVAATMIFNCMGFAGLMVFLHCLPGVFGPVAFMVVASLTNVGSMLAGVADKNIPWYALFLKQGAEAFSFCFKEFVAPKLDVFTLLTSVIFDWTSVVIYVSSIIIFVVCGALLMNLREFFYATE